MKNRLIALLLAIIMCVSVFPLSVFAAPVDTNGRIVVGNTLAFVGSTVTLNIDIADNPGIAGAKILVHYNEKLTLVSASAGETFKQLDYTAPAALVNGCAFNWDSLDAEVVEDGTLLSLTFEVSNNALANEILAVTVSYTYGDIYNKELDSLSFEITNGYISVIDYIPGDVNEDMTVNGKDVTLIRRYNAGYEVTLNELAADVNNDGTVNGKDVTLIRRYNAGYDVELKPSTPRCTHSNIQAVAAKEATCTEDGVNAHWYCASCGKYFNDADAKIEITVNDTVIVATGHTEVVDEAVAASCTNTGLSEGKHCSACDKILVAQIEIEKLNHTPGSKATCTENQICTACGEILESSNGHIPGVEASCTNPQICTVCQAVLVESLGHNLAYVAEKEPVDGNDPGNCAYWHCNKCQKCYLDEKATEEIALSDIAWKLFKVTYICDENKSKQIKWYKVGTEIDEIPELEIDGYEFNYWKDGTGKRVNSISAGNKDTIELYADLTVKTYTIHFGGTWNYEDISYTINDQKDLPDPIEDGLTFEGWRDPSGKVQEYIDNVGVRRWRIPKGTTGDIDLMAQWKDNRDFVIPYTTPVSERYVGSGYDETEKIYWFVYSLGEIKNCVLDPESSLIKTGHGGGHINGELSLAETKTVEKSVAESISKTVSHTVTNSTNWNESTNWNKTASVGVNMSVMVGAEIGCSLAKAKVEATVGTSFEASASVGGSIDLGGENSESDSKSETIETNFAYSTSLSYAEQRTMSFSHDVAPGNYYFANVGTVKVYAFVVYDPITNTFGLETFCTLDGTTTTQVLSDKKEDREYVSSNVLNYEVDVVGICDEIKDVFFVQYFANNGKVDEKGNVESVLKMYPIDAEVQLADKNLFSYTGYTFNRWETVDGIKYKEQETVKNLAEPGRIIVMNAKWDANKYTITYSDNKPSNASSSVTNMPSSKVYEYDTTVALGGKATLTGWTFGGWYLDAGCTKKVGDAGSEVVNLTDEPNGNIILYAKWEPISYTVNFDSNGGSSVGFSTVTFDSSYGALPTPTRLNCDFAGWYKGNTKIDNSTIVTTVGDHTLTARWTPHTTGYWNSGSRSKTITTSGWIEYWQTGLNREALREAGYTQFEITINMNGIFLSLDLFKADWWFEIYDRFGTQGDVNHMVVEENEEPWPRSWDNRWYTYTISIDAIRDDGTLFVWYDHSGDGADDFALGTVEIWVTAK